MRDLNPPLSASWIPLSLPLCSFSALFPFSVVHSSFFCPHGRAQHPQCFEISLLPFTDSLRWYILISTVCWNSLSVDCLSLHSWHNLLAFSCSLRSTIKQVISPKLYSLFHPPIGNTRNTKTMLSMKHWSHFIKGHVPSWINIYKHIMSNVFKYSCFFLTKCADEGIQVEHTGHLVNHGILWGYKVHQVGI